MTSPHDTKLDKKTEPATHYHRVKLTDVKPGSEYAETVHHAYREQIARLIQTNYLKRHPRKALKKDGEAAASAPTLRFIREPQGPVAEQYLDKHVAVLKSGKYLTLDFSDPEFERNIYKAYRLEKINRYQWSTALLLYQACKTFPGAVRQYRFDEKGPYDPAHISFINPQQLKQFQEKLRALPEGECTYFSLDLSKNQEKLFLFYALSGLVEVPGYLSPKPKYPYLQQPEKIQAILKQYISRLKISENLKNQYNQLIDDLKDPNKKQAAALKLFSLFKEQEKNWCAWFKENYRLLKNKPEFVDIIFLFDIQNIDNQLPVVQLSPHATDPDGPLLCFILPTSASMHTLQKTLFGKDMSEPLFTAGQFGVAYVRELDESAAMHGLAGQFRPIEMVHPDLPSQAKPHNYAVSPFLLTWHDVYHWWNNGTHFDKPFLRHLRMLLTREKGFYLSKSILDLSDMGFQYRSYLDAAKNENDPNHEMSIASRLERILDKTGIEFWTEIDLHDHNLLIIIDMIRNQIIWKQLLGVSATLELSNLCSSIQQWTYPNALSSFEQTYSKLAELMYRYPDRSLKFYCVMYRLSAKNQVKYQHNDMDDLFIWTRNNGLRFKSNKEKPLQPGKRALTKPDSHTNTTSPDAFTEKELAVYLEQEIQKVKPKKHLSSGGPGPRLFDDAKMTARSKLAAELLAFKSMHGSSLDTSRTYMEYKITDIAKEKITYRMLFNLINKIVFHLQNKSQEAFTSKEQYVIQNSGLNAIICNHHKAYPLPIQLINAMGYKLEKSQQKTFTEIFLTGMVNAFHRL